MPARQTHRLPPALALCPELRRPAARLSVSTRRLIELLLGCFPDAELLARDRSVAERTNTTPYEHLAADAITAARRLLETLDALGRPITLVAAPPDPSDQPDP